MKNQQITSNKRYNNLYVALYNFDAHESDDLTLKFVNFLLLLFVLPMSFLRFIKTFSID